MWWLKVVAIAKPVLDWAWENRHKASPVLAVLFCVLWLRGCGALTICEASLENRDEDLALALEQSEKVEANCKGKVVIKSVPHVVAGATIFQPCPEVTVDFEGNGGATSTQAATASAKDSPVQPIESGSRGIFVGGGYYGSPYVAAGVQWGPWAIQGQGNMLSWGGQATYQVLKF